MDINEFFYLVANGDEEAVAGLVKTIRDGIDDAERRNASA